MSVWSERFLGLAEAISSWSKDPSTKVGCVIVSTDKVILATGYNGLPRKVEDRPERMQRPAKYLWTSHAEANAVAHAARTGVSLDRSIAVVTHAPCASCARTLIQAGVMRVFVGDGTTSMPPEEFAVAAQMFEESGVIVEHVK